MRTYIELAKTPGLLRLTASQLLARFPLGILSLAILLHVQGVSGSYGLAGFVVAAVSAGEAIAIPLTSRLLGPWGPRRTIIGTSVLCSLALAILSRGDLAAPAYVLVGFVVGASIPPIMPAVRSLYPRLVSALHVPLLFSFDAASQELIWIGGPVVATLLSTTVSSAAPLLLASILTLGGGLWFITSPKLTNARGGDSRSRFGAVLTNRTVLVGLITSFVLVASFAALEIAVVARLSGDGALIGLALALASLGSLVGGAVFGHRQLGRPGLAVALGSTAAFTAMAAVAPGLPLLLAALFFSGLGFAPALATVYAMISADLKEEDSAEAFGWINTGSLIGGAAGTAVAGLLSDSFGSAGPFAAATGIALIGAAIPLVRSAGPRPFRQSTRQRN